MASDSVARDRTWLVRSPPDPLPAGTPMRQGYLASGGDACLRVRRAGDRHVATVQGHDLRRRLEVEWELTREQFEALWPLTEWRLDKVRHEVRLGSLTAEVDVFAGPLEGLVLVGVEFEDDDAMEAFVAPTWFGPDVSGDPRYGSASLARHGRPPEDPARRRGGPR